MTGQAVNQADGTGQTGQAVNQADGTPKGFEDISIATEWASK